MRSIVHAVRLHCQCLQIENEAALDRIAGAGYDLTPCGPPLRHLVALSEKLGEVCAAGAAVVALRARADFQRFGLRTLV